MSDRPRYARAFPPWSLAALIGAGLLAAGAQQGHALPLAQPKVPGAPGLVLVQQQIPAPEPSEAGPSEAGPEERLPFDELNAALAEARAKLERLTGPGEIAALAAGLREEQERIRQENRELAAKLEETTEALRAAEGQLEQAQAELAAGDEALVQLAADNDTLAQAAEESAAELARVREEVEKRQQQLEAAQKAREADKTRLEEAIAALEQSQNDAESLRAELATAQQELATTTTELTEAQRERGEADATTDALRAELENLREDLAAAQGETERVEARNVEVEAELAEWRDAADRAAAAARQDLAAIEDNIRLLDDALADVIPAAGQAPEAAEGSGATKDRQGNGSDPAISSAAATTTEAGTGARVPPVPPVEQAPQQQATLDASGEVGSARAAAERPADRASGTARMTLAKLTAELPLEERVQVENLLADVKAQPHPRGLVITVPGSEVFAVDSEAIDERAHETLARVAELINIYKDRQALIVGHTDAIGEAEYNQALSERRASLVKQFFVEHFEIDASRLSTAGLGEERPIAPNGTRAGREANRRVEVLIMN